MKKNVCFIICISFLILMTTAGCSINRKQHDEVYPVADNIDANIKSGTLSNKGMVLILENRDEIYTFDFGYNFILEENIDGKWYIVNTIREDIVTPSIGYCLESNECMEYKVGWTSIYGSLPSGDYRFKKYGEKVMYDGSGNVLETLGTFYFEVEFSI